MKKSHIALSLFFIGGMLLTLPSCRFGCKSGSGNLQTQTRNLQGFNSINIEGAYKLIIKQDSTYSFKLTADDNLLQYIETDINGSQLYLHTSRNICSARQFVITLSMPDVSLIKASGAVDVESAGKITAKDIAFDLSGTTKITMQLDADNVKTTGSGLTELNLKGQASTHTVELSGSGTLNTLDFVVAKYKIESSGISDCKINVLNSLNINSSGVSDIEYRGNPADIVNNKSGASTLKKIN